MATVDPKQFRYPSTLVSELRGAVADAISNASANDVPALCTRVGLEGGESEEAFRSKFKYAMRRLEGRSVDELLTIASLIISENSDSYRLSEAFHRTMEAHEQTITELTRRRIISSFEDRHISSELSMVEFFRRVFPTNKIPSLSARYHPHRTFDQDLLEQEFTGEYWGMKDTLEASGLLTCSQKQFFSFLEQLVHPIVQSPSEQASLVRFVNSHLYHDGYQLTVSHRISNQPVYAVRPKTGSPADEGISNVLASFDVDTIGERWSQALERRESNPQGAITLARTLLEDVCKYIIHESGEKFEEKDDLPVLYKRLARILNLAPDQHTENVFKQILGSCQSVVESIGALRNKLSDAHSPGPIRARPAPRHARLAVNLAGTMATFLIETWQSRGSAGKP